MRKRALLISDVDYTLLGDDDATARFAEWCGWRRDELVLVYASGRFCESIADSIRRSGLPEPDFLIGGVGTELRQFSDCAPLRQWEDVELPHWDARRIQQILETESELKPQPREFQSDRKISYFFHDARPADIQRIRNLLWDAGLRVDVIYSSQRDVDVVPAGINKGSAAAFVAQRVAPGCQHVMVSGDSGNDLPLFQQGFLGIVVANAHPELKALEGERVYVSPYGYADGVLDGLRYWLARQPSC